MEIGFTYAQTIFGMVFGGFLAHYFNGEWWGFALAIPALGALAYLASLARRRRLDLRPTNTFTEYMDAMKKRNDMGS